MKASGHTDDSLYGVGDRVEVVSIRFDYRHERIIGATGTVTDTDHDRNDGWFYKVQLDDDKYLPWVSIHGPRDENPVSFYETELEKQGQQAIQVPTMPPPIPPLTPEGVAEAVAAFMADSDPRVLWGVHNALQQARFVHPWTEPGNEDGPWQRNEVGSDNVVASAHWVRDDDGEIIRAEGHVWRRETATVDVTEYPTVAVALLWCDHELRKEGWILLPEGVPE